MMVNEKNVVDCEFSNHPPDLVLEDFSFRALLSVKLCYNKNKRSKSSEEYQ